jgi:hypothetical protein
MKRLILILAILVSLVVSAAAQAVPDLQTTWAGVPTIKQARHAIHVVDAYAFIGHCRRTHYSVVCGVTHEIEARTEEGSPTTAVIHLTDRVYRSRTAVSVRVLWEGTVSVSV